MHYLIRGIIIVIFALFLVGCGKFDHNVSGEARIAGPDKIEVEDSNHNVTVYYGVHPDTIKFIENTCNNQDDEPVFDCISDLLNLLVINEENKNKESDNTVEGLINGNVPERGQSQVQGSGGSNN
jgi:hypothetical protein